MRKRPRRESFPVRELLEPEEGDAEYGSGIDEAPGNGAFGIEVKGRGVLAGAHKHLIKEATGMSESWETYHFRNQERTVERAVPNLFEEITLALPVRLMAIANARLVTVVEFQVTELYYGSC